MEYGWWMLKSRGLYKLVQWCWFGIVFPYILYYDGNPSQSTNTFWDSIRFLSAAQLTLVLLLNWYWTLIIRYSNDDFKILIGGFAGCQQSSGTMEADFESFLVPQIPELVEGKIYQKPPGRSLFKSMVSTTVDVPFNRWLPPRSDAGEQIVLQDVWRSGS